ncbi:MAG TPA: ATP-dependent protease LonB [Methanomicrobia archaeon]|nr:ATP-dependent protease LonB [Methanomicrobia archaeon]
MTDEKEPSMPEENDIGYTFETTKEIEIPTMLIDQVIGQDEAVETIRIAAKQRRNVLLIGDPGTGKSMLGQAMAELLPRKELEDIICYPNEEDPNTPKIRSVRAGQGKAIVNHHKQRANQQENTKYIVLFFVIAIVLFLAFTTGQLLTGILIIVLLIFLMQNMTRSKGGALVPKLLVDNSEKTTSPYVEGTGAHAGALLGDVRHDPFQSGGLGTPPHERVEAGMIHRAHKGVLFIDEISTFQVKMQQAILTALQDNKYSITGQSEMSSGAMVRTESAPCDFVLIAAGNIETVRDMHPALRSRIRGYGYELYMNDAMKDTLENRRRIVQVVAQEVHKDGKIPHFTYDAVQEIVNEARRRAGRKGYITMRIRELGGLIRTAGDVANRKDKDIVDVEDVLEGKHKARTLEHQIADKYIEKKRQYQIIRNTGQAIGRINGLAVMGDSGIISTIEAEAAPSASKEEGKIIAAGKLGDIAKESVQNVSALAKKYIGKDISNFDIHVQFLQAYEGVEGDSASISIATAVISALTQIPIRQDVAMTGSLSVRGEVLPIGGVNAKIEAAIDAGMKVIIVPHSNKDDVLLDARHKEKATIRTVRTIAEVFEYAFTGEHKDELVSKVRTFLEEDLG